MYAVDRIEVTLTVPSIERTAAWYERVLGWVSHYDALLTTREPDLGRPAVCHKRHQRS